MATPWLLKLSEQNEPRQIQQQQQKITDSPGSQFKSRFLSEMSRYFVTFVFIQSTQVDKFFPITQTFAPSCGCEYLWIVMANKIPKNWCTRADTVQ